MASSKVTVFVHCVGLVQLSSYVIGGISNFRECNFSNISAFSEIIQPTILTAAGSSDSARNIIDCCPSRSLPEAEKPAEQLACIFNFTVKCIAPTFPGIWNATDRLLLRQCPKYDRPGPANNASQDIELRFLGDSRKCSKQRKNNSCGKNPIQELRHMWDSYQSQIATMN